MSDSAPQPEKQAETGRDPSTGRFLPGASGNPRGRPRGIDMRSVASERAAAEGLDLEGELWAIIKSLVARAKQTIPDVAAARVVFELLVTDQAIADEVADLEERLRELELQVGGLRDPS